MRSRRSHATRTDAGWRTNRNNMRLSITAHVRATQRRRTISEALALGITHFRLDIPKRHLGHVAPDGILGPHLWKVRTFEEWKEIEAKANADRIASSAFDTIGLGFGDLSYVTAVPDEMVDEAIADGERLRGRWLAV